jgi:hypothetical protein
MTDREYWVCIAKRDYAGSWHLVPDALMTPADARSRWDAGLIDMAQKRTGPEEFSLYVHMRSERDRKRQPMFSYTSTDDYKSVRPLSRINPMGRNR